MTDMGAVGLGLLLTVLFQFVWRSSEFIRLFSPKTRRMHPPLQDIWCVSAMVSFFVSTLLGFHQDMLYLMGYVGVIVGVGGPRSGEVLPHPNEHSPRSSEFIRRACENHGRINSPLRPLPSRLRQCLVVVVLLMVGIPCAFREAGKSLFEKATTLFETRRDALGTARLLEQAVTVWPPLAEAHSYLGELLMDMGDWPASERSLRAAIHWSPTAGFLHDDLAELLTRMGRKEEALEEVEKAISLHPVKYTYHLRRSRLLYDLGRTSEAARAREQGEYLEQYEPRYEEARKAQAARTRG